ncbi:MAG: hypothetical protein LBQ66_11155 [Planctomycetaceae bacterium]|jgi:hypothetical protein|nr:hypothetical protein [Planctomycetaceae bacterium]
MKTDQVDQTVNQTEQTVKCSAGFDNEKSCLPKACNLTSVKIGNAGGGGGSTKG